MITSNIKVNFTDNSLLSWYSLEQKSRLMRDRFGSLNKYSPFKFSKTYDKIPSISSMNGTYEEFRDIFYKKIENICKKYKNIYIMWSGGVDSTALLCGLINYGCKNLYVLCTEDSIQEYPFLYEKIKTSYNINFITHEYMTQFSYSLKEDEILLIGTPGDQLFGSTLSYKYNTHCHNNWKEFFINTTYNYKSLIFQNDYALTEYKLVDYIKTTQALFWWLNFSVKWEYVHLFYPCTKQVYHIYADKQFQEWCMSRIDIINDIPYTNPLYYKRELKNIIFEVTKDYEYFKNKIKEGSYQKLDKYATSLRTPIVVFKDGIKTYLTDELALNDIMSLCYER